MEFLVHNISHSDLLVELSWLRTDSADVPTSNSSNSNSNSNRHTGPSTPSSPTVDVDGTAVPLTILGRPKYSLVQPTSRQILAHLQHHTADATAPDDRWTARCRATQLPIGFNLAAAPIAVRSSALWNDFQLRGERATTSRVARYWDRVAITAVYFPLLALLLPKWRHVLEAVDATRRAQLVYLISGAGIPRDVGPLADVGTGNSTEATGALLALFGRAFYGHLTVVQLHSGSNIFRFDDNVQFMTRELRPLLDAHRETLVDRFGDQWQAQFHVTIAYADGPPARLSALNAALRLYRPSYLHMWQLKTFWRDARLSLADVDFHAFEHIEASPVVALRHVDALTQRIVAEMQTFRDQFLAADVVGQGEVASFWLRKSRKPVLAVLLVEQRATAAGARPTLVVQRGMNCEVSMPTGSLCAERNAIGSALASDPTLTRRALKMIAVLGLTLRGDGVPDAHRIITNGSSAVSAIESGDESEERLQGLTEDRALLAASGRTDATGDTSSAQRLGSVTSGAREGGGSRKHRLEPLVDTGAKRPRCRSFPCDESVADGRTEDSALVDRNPLAPCGACNEWLVKIAEANPSFRVITFANARCQSIYVNQII